MRSKKSPKPATPKLRWQVGRLTTGPCPGTFWGACVGKTFLMIVYRKKSGANPGYYEVWSEGIVHDEAKNRTLAQAKAFAERSLPHILSGKYPTRKAA